MGLMDEVLNIQKPLVKNSPSQDFSKFVEAEAENDINANASQFLLMQKLGMMGPLIFLIFIPLRANSILLVPGIDHLVIHRNFLRVIII